jgi:antitoxin component YwqK of YwqJK toxin-antitoxin module
MIRKFLIILAVVIIPGVSEVFAQETLNFTDAKGLKQGHWIKKSPEGIIIYDGYFQDNYPVGPLKRFYDDQTIKTILNYSEKGRKAVVEIYHPNGYKASDGVYFDQMKEGKWRFYSSVFKDYCISEEYYHLNKKDGTSTKFYRDSTIAETSIYRNGLKEGEMISYYPSGSIWTKSHYENGKLSGKFEVWFEKGSLEITGNYINDARDSQWIFYRNDGTTKYKVDYQNGITKNRVIDIDESAFLDSLENNRGKIADPEKTGIIN